MGILTVKMVHRGCCDFIWNIKYLYNKEYPLVRLANTTQRGPGDKTATGGVLGGISGGTLAREEKETPEGCQVPGWVLVGQERDRRDTWV